MVQQFAKLKPKSRRQASYKVRAKKVDGDDLLNDAGLMSALKLWAQSGKVENMDVERILALFRHSVGKNKAAVVDRLIPAGFLAQWRAAHRTCGGLDPSIASRDSLTKLPSRANIRKERSSRPSSRPAILYMIDKVRARKASGVVKSRQDISV